MQSHRARRAGAARGLALRACRILHGKQLLLLGSDREGLLARLRLRLYARGLILTK